MTGYDVWLGNFRGNTYSRGHVNRTIQERTYWSFTWDEHAQYDLPAMVSHMMSVTKVKEYCTVLYCTVLYCTVLYCTVR